MNKPQEQSIQILHFNDSYDIELTPLFTSSLLSKESEFLVAQRRQLLKQRQISKSISNVSFTHTIRTEKGYPLKVTDKVFYQRTNNPSLKMFSGDLFFPSFVSNLENGKQFTKFLQVINCDFGILGRL